MYILSKRNVVAQETLSDAEIDGSAMTDEAQRAALQANIEKFLKNFEDLYTHLLNNVRVNLPKQLKPITEGLAALDSLADIKQEDVAAVAPALEQKTDAITTRMDAAANAVRRIMSTIIQECNQIKNSMKTT